MQQEQATAREQILQGALTEDEAEQMMRTLKEEEAQLWERVNLQSQDEYSSTKRKQGASFA
jgi:hypothetical protein